MKKILIFLVLVIGWSFLSLDIVSAASTRYFCYYYDGPPSNNCVNINVETGKSTESGDPIYEKGITKKNCDTLTDFSDGTDSYVPDNFLGAYEVTIPANISGRKCYNYENKIWNFNSFTSKQGEYLEYRAFIGGEQRSTLLQNIIKTVLKNSAKSKCCVPNGAWSGTPNEGAVCHTPEVNDSAGVFQTQVEKYLLGLNNNLTTQLVGLDSSWSGYKCGTTGRTPLEVQAGTSEGGWQYWNWDCNEMEPILFPTGQTYLTSPIAGITKGTRSLVNSNYCIRETEDMNEYCICLKTNKSDCNNIHIYGKERCEAQINQIAKDKDKYECVSCSGAGVVDDENRYEMPPGYDGPLPECAFDGSCRDVNDFLELAINIGKWLFSIIGGLAFAFFVYGGFTMIISFGNAEKFKKGGQILVAAFFGVLIAFSAYLIVNFLLDTIGVDETLNFIQLQ